ncbi:MAG: VIT domain-containing protein [Isosphaeraceae bacterium]
MTTPRALPLLEEASCLSETPPGDAGFGALETIRGRLPLAALDVHGRIDGLLAQVTMRQVFVNVNHEPLEATYIFPLPDRAAVTGFRMEVAGRVIEGVLQERAQARREYDQALRQGHRATIAEEERPGVFTLRVGNLMPGDRAAVELTMAGALPYLDGEVTFRFPLVVAPRYIPGVPLDGPSVGDGAAVDTDAVPDASRISPPVLLPSFPSPVRLSLAVDLHDSGVPAEDVRVSLHAVCEEPAHDEGMRRIILKPGARLDRDFILRFRLGGSALRTAFSLHPDAGSGADGEGTFALAIVPPLRSQTEAGGDSSRPRDVALVLDRSGSMAGWKMVAARRAMARMIDTLTAADRFLVLAFDDRIETPPYGDSGLIPATDRNRYGSVEFLGKLESRGGTEIAEPLKLAVSRLSAAGRAGEGDRARWLERDRILVLVTDGQVGNEDQVLGAIGSQLGGIRIFTLGIDQAVNEGFLRRLAERGSAGGSCELVESNERLDAVMESIHRRIATPVLTDVTLEEGQAGLELVADSLVPARPPCLFDGSPLLVLGRYRGRPHRALRVRAMMGDGTAWSEEVTPVVRENPAIASAWARGQIRRLEDDYAAGLGDRQALERSIVATSLRFGVLCRFTAYVAIDRAAVVNEGGKAHQITQPVEMPAGWAERSTFGAIRAVAGGARLPSPSARSSSRIMSGPDLAMSAPVEIADAFMEPPACLPPSSTPPEGIVRRSRHGKLHLPTFKKGQSRTEERVPPPPFQTPSADELVRRAGFVLLEETGRDHYGTIHKARDPRGKLVALRLLKNPFDAGSPRKLAMLEKKLTALRHPAIVPILRLIAEPAPTNRVVAIVSEYVSEPTLENWRGKAEPIDTLESARLVLALAEALHHAARRGMVHGLLAPERIRIAAAGAPRIEEFGLASLGCRVDVADVHGWAYAAPELLRASTAPPTERTDIYSLAAVLYRLLTGELPAGRIESGPGGGRRQARVRDQFWKAAADVQSPGTTNPQIPTELQTICVKALESDPAARCASWAQLIADLRRFLGIKRPGWLKRRGEESAPPPSP